MALVPHNLNINHSTIQRRNPSPSASSSSSTALVPASPDLSLHLLNSILFFYDQRKQWVQRSRSSLELAFVQGSLALHPTIGDGSETDTDTDCQSDSTGSAPSLCSDSDGTNEPSPQSAYGPSIKQEASDDAAVAAFSSSSRALVPLTLRATTTAQAPSSRWLKRKQSFKLTLGPLTQRAPTRPRRCRAPEDGPEPAVLLLERFGDLLDARMESCLRITRLVRSSNRALLRRY